LASRMVGVPAELARWNEAHGGIVQGEDTSTESLGTAAARALARALSGPSRDRETAYALLAADALLTDAAGRTAAAPDPDAALVALLDALQGGQDG